MKGFRVMLLLFVCSIALIAAINPPEETGDDIVADLATPTPVPETPVRAVNVIDGNGVLAGPKVLESADPTDAQLRVELHYVEYFMDMWAKTQGSETVETGGFWTRAYATLNENGVLEPMVPGPTLKVRPGQELIIEFHNDLGPNENVLGDAAFQHVHNQYTDFNTTNFHTHGFHVSSLSTDVNGDGQDDTHSDNVLIAVEPGQSVTYHYHIPSDHAPGIHWYHAHHHGSTALQVAGGSSGMIVVEEQDTTDDQPWSAPDDLKNMPTSQLIVQQIDRSVNLYGETSVTIDAAQKTNHPPRPGGGGEPPPEEGGDGAQTTIIRESLVNSADNLPAGQTHWNFANHVFLTNGESAPQFTMSPNTWHRLQIVYSGVSEAITVEFPTDCVLKILAKDGVYLMDAPRSWTGAFTLHPGNRVDVALKCNAATQQAKPVLRYGGTEEVTFFSLFIDGSAGSNTEQDWEKGLRYVFPPYLSDLRDYEGGEVVSTHTSAFNGVQGTCQVNGESFPENAVSDYNFAIGTIQDIRIEGVGGHPFHMHVNPYQLQANGDNTVAPWHLAGDWLDVYSGNNNNIRFQPENWYGKYVIHCHFLHHEDKGCMAFWEATEGIISSGTFTETVEGWSPTEGIEVLTVQ